MRLTGRLKDKVASWQGVLVFPHQFAAKEYRYGTAEIGHVHLWGDVDIPFPKAVHDYLLEHGLAEQHRWVPNSGWTTFRMRKDKDVAHAIWLMRLSYLRYALKKAADPAGLLEAEAERLRLDPALKEMLRRFVPGGGVAAA